MRLEVWIMSKDSKDMFKTGWIQPPTIPFGGSQFDHKVAKEKELAQQKAEESKSEKNESQ